MEFPQINFESLVKNISAEAAKPASTSFSPEFMLLQLQMMIAESADEQLRDVADKIKFLKEVVTQYRANISTVEKFLAQPTHSKDDRQVIDATSGQMAELMGAMTIQNYNLADQTMTTQGIGLFDMEGRNKLNTESETWDGKTNTLDLKNYFENLTQLGTKGITYNEEDVLQWSKNTHRDPSEYSEKYVVPRKRVNQEYLDEAKKTSPTKDMQLPFQFNEKAFNNTGTPAFSGAAPGTLSCFSVYAEQIEKLLTVLNNKITSIETDIEQLGTKLTDLTEKRKQAFESANSLLHKSSEIQNNTVNKF